MLDLRAGQKALRMTVYHVVLMAMTNTDLMRLQMTDLRASDQVVSMDVIKVDLKALQMAVSLVVTMALMKVHMVALLIDGYLVVLNNKMKADH